MILLDTNVLSELMKISPNELVIQQVNSVAASNVYISAITYAEIMQGIALLKKGKRQQQLQNTATRILDLFNKKTLSFERESSFFYADIIQQRTQIGRPIDFPDAQIAAIALQHGLQLFTRNTKAFEKIANLKLINPFLPEVIK